MDKSVPKNVHANGVTPKNVHANGVTPKNVLPDTTGTIVIEDKSVIKLLTDKEALILEGRGISKEIDDVQKKIDVLSKKEMKITGKIEPKDLIKRGDELKDIINSHVKELEQVAQAIRKAKMDAIPEEIKTEHYALNDQREKLEQKRNKLALKVQKIKDRLIPKLKKHATGHLDEFEDLLSADLVEGKVVVSKFSHIDEWKRLWKEKNK